MPSAIVGWLVGGGGETRAALAEQKREKKLMTIHLCPHVGAEENC